MLRSHSRTMDALRALAEVGTKESRERAQGALFERDETERTAMRCMRARDESGSERRPMRRVRRRRLGALLPIIAKDQREALVAVELISEERHVVTRNTSN